jgi:phage tail-like protein
MPSGGMVRGIVSRMAIFKNSPYAGFNFLVTIDGSEPAAFSTVVIPTVEIDVIEYRDGSDKLNRPRQIVGLTKYTNLVLKRGLAPHPDLWAWFDQVRQGTIDRRSVVVTLLNEEHSPVMVWTLRRCLPIKWTGPTLNAHESDVAIEAIELAVEGLDVESV